MRYMIYSCTFDREQNTTKTENVVKHRWRRNDGNDEFLYPKQRAIDMHQELLLTYLNHLKSTKQNLSEIIKNIAINNTVIVVTANMGQSELLMNLICSSRRRGLDTKNLLVFPTDVHTKELAESLGLTTFYDDHLMRFIPKEESARYGDRTFALIMIAKVVCVQLVNELGYDLLFTDIDVVFYRDPMEYFRNPTLGNFDVYFQDDGSRQERYAPYSANSGMFAEFHLSTFWMMQSKQNISPVWNLINKINAMDEMDERILFYSQQRKVQNFVP